MFDASEAIMVEELEIGQCAEGEIPLAVKVTTVKHLSKSGTPMGPVDYKRIVLMPCGHAKCGNVISYNLN